MCGQRWVIVIATKRKTLFRWLVLLIQKIKLVFSIVENVVKILVSWLVGHFKNGGSSGLGREVFNMLRTMSIASSIFPKSLLSKESEGRFSINFVRLYAICCASYIAAGEVLLIALIRKSGRL